MTINQQLYGSDTPLPTYTELKAGPMTIGYEAGSFRYFRWGNDEILRMVYVSLRDENWGTLIPIRTNEVVTREADQFRVRYDCHYKRDATVLFSWHVAAEGHADGSFRMTIAGQAHQPFLRNRAGFCILHPIQDTTGQPCELLHPGGQWEASRFPEFISPENPFKELAGMRWQHVNGAWFRLDMTGDVFETEDQRNWTDASYKTFCTPSDLPMPVLLRAGDGIQQQISFRPEQPLPALPETEPDVIAIRVIDEERSPLPKLGVAASTDIPVLTEPAYQSLESLSLAHYRVEVIPAQADWKTNFLVDVRTATAAGIPVLAALYVSDNYLAELSDFLTFVHREEVLPAGLMLFSTDAPVTTADVLTASLPILRNALPKTRIGAGTDYNFTELNRSRPETTGLDFICYSLHPQVHAFDNRSMIETLATQGDTVRTAKTFSSEVPIYVSAVTLRQRANPYAHQPADRARTNDQKGDPRQPSLWAAGWTLGSVKYLAEAGAASVTYFQTAGGQGIMSADGHWYPAGMVLRAIQAFWGGQVIRTESSEPLVLSTLLLSVGTRRAWLVANHTEQSRRVQFPEMVRVGYRITPFPAQQMPLDLDTDSPFVIEPFGVWVLEG